MQSVWKTQTGRWAPRQIWEKCDNGKWKMRRALCDDQRREHPPWWNVFNTHACRVLHPAPHANRQWNLGLSPPSKINPPSTRLLTQKPVTRVNLQLLTRESGQVIKSGASESDGEAERNHKSLTYSCLLLHNDSIFCQTRSWSVQVKGKYTWEYAYFLTRVDPWEGGEEPGQGDPLGGSEHDRASAALNS